MSTEEFLLARIRELEAKVTDLEERELSRKFKHREKMKKLRLCHHRDGTVTAQKNSPIKSTNLCHHRDGTVGVYIEMVKPSLKKDIYTLGIPDPDFEEFWKLYPRRVGKAPALKAYRKAKKEGACKEEILKGVTTLKASQTELRFVPHASTWLNQHRWQDEAAHISPKSNVIKINKSGIPGVDW